MNNLPSIAVNLWHNAAAAVYQSDEIVTVIEFERLLNLKNASFEFFEPIHTKDFILKELYDYLKREYGFTKYNKFIIGVGHHQFPERYKQIIPAEEYLMDEVHHTQHALGSLYQSNLEKALIFSFDGGSNDGYFRMFIGEKQKDLIDLGSMPYDLGSHYHTIGAFCEDIKNYHHLTAAGKVLGLQSYGKVIESWKAPLKKWFTTGVPYSYRLKERTEILSSEIGLLLSGHQNRLQGETAYDFSRTAQEVFEEIFFESVDSIVKQYELPIILTGGCALNIVLNTNVKRRYNREVFVSPNSSDVGLSVGMLCKHLKPNKIIDITYKGIPVLDRNNLMEYIETRRAVPANIDQIVEDLRQDRIMGVVQGRSEHGPRALGNRSIICSPLSPNMKDVLNHKVKHREWYRPFAPIVRLEDVSEYFEWEGESRWMNFCPKVRDKYKSVIPSVTHVDGTARVQTITREQNPFIYDLLTKFKERTGVGVLINTSFNVDRKPILSSYKDALKVFDETQLDRLYLEGFYFSK